MRIRWVTTVAVLAFISTAAHAQVAEGSPVGEADGDIIVTATKSGAQGLQKVPLAVTAFSAEMIEERGSISLADLAPVTPGFSYTYNSVWSVASIRGIGTNNVFAGGDPSTTLQVDGVYYGRPTGANLDFLDVERVEVLRGPQGTLYGRNAIGGTVNVITSDPGNELRAQFRVTGGNYNLVRPEGSISGPISDGVSFSVAGRYSNRDDYTRQLNPALSDNWNEHRYAFRAKLKFDLSSNLSLIVGGDVSHSNERINGFTVRLSPPLIPDGFNPDFHEAALSDRNYGLLTQKGTSGKITWDMGGTTITSITAYRKSDTQFGGDLDFSAAPLFYTRSFVEHQNQISQEFDLSGKFGDASYVVGLFGYRERAKSFFNAVVFGTLLTQGIDAVTKSYAAFGQVNYPLSERFKFTAGIRYTIDQKSAENIFGAQTTGITSDLNQSAAGTGPIFSGNNTRHALTPKFGVEFQATSDLLTYASITRGFKSGGYNLLIDPSSTSAAQYGPERVWAYEGGLKVSIPQVKGHFNLAAFYYDYSGLQVNQFVFLGATVAQLVNNAKKADVKGIEAEAAFRPLQPLELGGTFAWLDASYAGSFNAIDNFNNVVTNPDGRQLNDAPKWSGSGYAQFNIPIGDIDVNLRGDAIYKSKVFYTPLNDIRLGAPSRWLFNAGLTIAPQDSGLQVGVRVDNIANKRYVTAAYYTFSAGGQPGEPRTVRGFIGYKF
jgi:iron complex outermembrane recepter protein